MSQKISPYPELQEQMDRIGLVWNSMGTEIQLKHEMSMTVAVRLAAVYADDALLGEVLDLARRKSYDWTRYFLPALFLAVVYRDQNTLASMLRPLPNGRIQQLLKGIGQDDSYLIPLEKPAFIVGEKGEKIDLHLKKNSNKEIEQNLDYLYEKMVKPGVDSTAFLQYIAQAEALALSHNQLKEANWIQNHFHDIEYAHYLYKALHEVKGDFYHYLDTHSGPDSQKQIYSMLARVRQLPGRQKFLAISDKVLLWIDDIELVEEMMELATLVDSGKFHQSHSEAYSASAYRNPLSLAEAIARSRNLNLFKKFLETGALKTAGRQDKLEKYLLEQDMQEAWQIFSAWKAKETGKKEAVKEPEKNKNESRADSSTAKEIRKRFGTSYLQEDHDLARKRSMILAYKGNEKAVVIPTMLGRSPIVALHDFAFDASEQVASSVNMAKVIRYHESRAQVEGIKIPEGIESIGEGCFRNCRKLKTVVLPRDLQHIARNAFYNCDSLHELVIPGARTSVDVDFFPLAEMDLPQSPQPFVLQVIALEHSRTAKALKEWKEVQEQSADPNHPGFVIQLDLVNGEVLHHALSEEDRIFETLRNESDS